MAAEPAVSLLGVTVRFGEVTAVDALSLDVRQGELLMLVGASGSGKTTALETINRLVEPDEGEVRLKGEPVRDLVPHILRRRIGYAFQGVGLFPHMTVAENIGITPKLLGWAPSRIADQVASLLRLVDLSPEEHGPRLPSALSGGQRQRVGVARALAAEPEVVLFDEPFGALDPLTREQLQSSFATLRRELGFTGVFVTHDVHEALMLGDRVAVMRQGRLLQVGTPAELSRSPSDVYVSELLSAPRRAADLVASRLDTP
ncbi:MAG: ATP-binding cassette domain-containing protein [Sandaracinaceae bacterium]